MTLGSSGPSFPLPKVPGGSTEVSHYTIAARSASPLVPFVSATVAMTISVELLTVHDVSLAVTGP